MTFAVRTLQSVSQVQIARYWRLYITANNGSSDGYTSVQELELRNAAGVDQTSPGMSSNQSDYFYGSPAANTIDNNTTDYVNSTWVSGTTSGDHWLSVDLGAPKDVAQLALLCQAYASGPSRAPKDFLLQRSDNGSTWTTVLTVTNATGYVVGAYKTFTL